MKTTFHFNFYLYSFKTDRIHIHIKVKRSCQFPKADLFKSRRVCYQSKLKISSSSYVYNHLTEARSFSYMKYFQPRKETNQYNEHLQGVTIKWDLRDYINRIWPRIRMTRLARASFPKCRQPSLYSKNWPKNPTVQLFLALW